MTQQKLIAIDFDGTLFEDDYPLIGKPKLDIINKCKELKKRGYGLILWTCREADKLDEAILALSEQGLVFDYINENPKHRIDLYNGSDCRKVGADYYLDDRNITEKDFINLDTNKKRILSKK